MNLKNKTILITGANGGLGTELVKVFIKAKAKKIYCAVRDVKENSSLKELSSQVELITLDICDYENIKSLSAKIENIDMLVNNAGANSKKRIFESSTVDFDVNVMGTLNLTKYLSSKINQNGMIINITSITALINSPLIGLYSASKSALHSLTQAMRAEMSLKQIHVLEVLPGPIDTNMTKGRDMPKAKAFDIASEILTGIKNEVCEVYPDEFSKRIKNSLEKDSRSVELEFQKTLS